MFSKGASFCLAEQADLGYEVLGIDWTIDPKKARELVKGKNVTLQGNLDPCALYASKEDIEKLTAEMIKKFGCLKYVVNLGHGIYPDMRVDAVETFINKVHDIVV